MRYRAVLFDLDDTLRFSRPSHREVFARVLAEQGFPQKPEALRRLWRWSHAFWADQKRVDALRAAYREDPEGFWRAWHRLQLAKLGIPEAHHQRVVNALVQAMQVWRETAEDWVPPEHMALLQNLRARGLRLGLITNRGEPLEGGYLERLGLAPFLDTVVVAADVGTWKPNPRIFHLALEALQVPPHQALYVGDNYYADYIGGRAAGLTAVLYDPEDLFAAWKVPKIRHLPDLQRWLNGTQRD